MQDFKAFFKNKRVTVMRVGLIGRGIGDTAYLAEAGANILVVDDASQEVMQPAVDKLKQYSNVTFKFGPYDNVDFENRDFILVGAGAPLDLPCLVHAQKMGVRLVQSAALFAELSQVPIIGVTGTRGKSTVTHMIHHVLTHMTEGGKVLLGGNVRGVSNLQLLNDVVADTIAVMELDSWQLQGWGWSGMSPHIAVFTTFMEDHMNYYNGDMNAYFKDKAQIFEYQGPDSVFVTTREIFERANAYMHAQGKVFQADVRLVDASMLPDDCVLAMPGEHNRLNAALATEALRAIGLTDDEIFEGLTSFPGVPGRLEYLGEIQGIKIYNDNNATTPNATMAGIKAVGAKKNVLLIAGGADKNIPLDPLIEAILEYTKAVVLIPGTGTERLRKSIDVPVAASLEEAIEYVLSKGAPGDVLLFSPAFASFGMFKNEYDRNDQFVTYVTKKLGEGY